MSSYFHIVDNSINITIFDFPTIIVLPDGAFIIISGYTYANVKEYSAPILLYIDNTGRLVRDTKVYKEGKLYKKEIDSQSVERFYKQYKKVYKTFEIFTQNEYEKMIIDTQIIITK